MEKLIITCAVTGFSAMKSDTPYIPITPDEIVEETYRAYQAGASIVHLHARDPKTGKSVADNALFKEYYDRIREKCDIIVNITTGGGREVPPEKLDDVIHERIRLKPDMDSLNMGSVNVWFTPISDDVFINSTARVERWAKWMLEEGVKPELEIYDTGMINIAATMIERGVIREPAHYQFVMIGKTGISPTVKNLAYLAEEIPRNATWSVCAIGRYEMPMAAVAITMGGHVRVGFEDNIYLSRGVLAKSNAELVGKVVRMAKELGREIASPEEARKILNIPPRR
jgi:3-keto-5-aminohexanoate cleavage enzyme